MAQLFRKEALENRSRGLFGEVRLAAPIPLWVITVLLIALAGGIVAALTLIHVQTAEGAMTLLQWMLAQS